jgi:hypothetical protein
MLISLVDECEVENFGLMVHSLIEVISQDYELVRRITNAAVRRCRQKVGVSEVIELVERSKHS